MVGADALVPEELPGGNQPGPSGLCGVVRHVPRTVEAEQVPTPVEHPLPALVLHPSGEADDQ